jgi:hypothetical protein
LHWLFVKDVLNKNFRSIPNNLNDNRPVTNSRDCQEVPYNEGMTMLEIYRDFNEHTSIIDDLPNFEK